MYLHKQKNLAFTPVHWADCHDLGALWLALRRCIGGWPEFWIALNLVEWMLSGPRKGFRGGLVGTRTLPPQLPHADSPVVPSHVILLYRM